MVAAIVLGDRRPGQRDVAVVIPQRIEVGPDLENAQLGAFHTGQGRPGDSREAPGVADQQLRLAVFEAVQDLVAYPPAVETDRDRAEAHGRPEGLDPLGAVGGEDRDAIASSHAEAIAQRGGELRDAAEILGVRDAAPVVTDQILGVAVRGRRGEQRPQRRHALLEDARRLA